MSDPITVTEAREMFDALTSGVHWHGIPAWSKLSAFIDQYASLEGRVRAAEGVVSGVSEWLNEMPGSYDAGDELTAENVKIYLGDVEASTVFNLREQLRAAEGERDALKIYRKFAIGENAAPETATERDHLKARVAELEAERAKLPTDWPDDVMDDCIRYRWLRGRDVNTIGQGGIFAGKTPDNVILTEGDLDAAIDEALNADPVRAAFGGERMPTATPVGRDLLVALSDAAAHLCGAASAYAKYAKRAATVGKSETDPFFSTRVKDFQTAADRAVAALSRARDAGVVR